MNHCGDWLDEMYCDTSRGFSCPGNSSGAVSWFEEDKLCDGTKDCRDGDDEIFGVREFLFSRFMFVGSPLFW